MDTPEEYQRLINLGQHLLNNTEENWQLIPAERIPFARMGQGMDGLFLAVGHLMLGDMVQARKWFRQCAEYFLEGLKPADTVLSEKRALECALLCGDREFQVHAAQQILPREQRVKPMEYPYVMVLKHAILGQQKDAASFVEDSAWLSRATLKKRGGYGTLQDVCTAVICEQPEEFASNLQALLAEHKKITVQGRKNMPDGILCFPGAALLILARTRGWSVQVTSPFIPDALLTE